MYLGKKYFLILIFSSLLWSACAKDYVTGKSSYNWFSLKSDIQLGNQVLQYQQQAFVKKGVAIDSEKNQPMRARIQNIVNRLSQVSHIPNLPYEVHVADAPIVNAWAAPGGKIMVYEGLWDPEKGLIQKESDEELAAVLSHEMGHCTARHVTKAISRQMTISLIGVAVSSAIAGAGSAQGSDLFGEIFNQGMSIYVPSYSRKNEGEADRIGLFYMAKAGYDPRAAVALWKRASEKKGDETSIYASHPSSGDRYKAMEHYLPEAIMIYEQNKP